MFTVWSFGEALRADVSFSAGCVYVPELRSVMRITPIFVKDALRHALSAINCVSRARGFPHSDVVRLKPESLGINSTRWTDGHTRLLIRGPTHVTQTDVWVSRGDTLSLFKRRGNPCSGNAGC